MCQWLHPPFSVFYIYTLLQYSCLENRMAGGAWKAAVHGVAEGRTRLNDFLSLFTFMHWRRKWQPTPVFLPGESQGRGSLVGCRLMGSHRFSEIISEMAGHNHSNPRKNTCETTEHQIHSHRAVKCSVNAGPHLQMLWLF